MLSMEQYNKVKAQLVAILREQPLNAAAVRLLGQIDGLQGDDKTRDKMMSVAARLSARLGILQTAASYDLVAACAGLPYALAEAVRWLQARNRCKGNPLLTSVSAVSVGIVDGELLLDLAYVAASQRPLAALWLDLCVLARTPLVMARRRGSWDSIRSNFIAATTSPPRPSWSSAATMWWRP